MMSDGCEVDIKVWGTTKTTNCYQLNQVVSVTGGLTGGREFEVTYLRDLKLRPCPLCPP